jgi:hypothetical protein
MRDTEPRLFELLTPPSDIPLEEVDVIENGPLVSPRKLPIRAVHQLHAVLELE